MSDKILLHETISIVTISFNQGKYISSCIDSVANQEGPFEHITVDPGSTDGSRKIIEDKSDHFSKIIFEPDTGPANGLNKGFQHATGEILCYLNSDDILMPGTFAEIRRLFARWPDVDVISGGGYIIDENGRRGRRLRSDPVSRLGLAYGGSIQIQPSTFIRRAAFEKTKGFNETNRSNWDGELIVDLFLSGARFRQVNSTWSGYRLHDESITATGRLDSLTREHARRMHLKLMGYESGRLQNLFRHYFRLRRIIRNPSIIVDRLINGRVYGG